MKGQQLSWAGLPQTPVWILRYGLGILGPLSVSVAHFVASLALLHALEPSEFGLFAFVLVMVQFSFGLSTALIGAPFTVNANLADYKPAQGLLFFKANLLLSLCAGLACGGVAWGMGANHAAPLILVFAGLTVLRWFLRSYFFALHRLTSVLVSDLTYSLALLTGLGLAWHIGLTLETASTAFVSAALLAVMLAGMRCLRQQLWECLTARLGDYSAIWRHQSRWTLLGVTTTEATANAHAWLVTLVVGPAAFAPLAVAALLFRPVLLAAGSLSQLERPLMARALANGARPRALVARRHFRLAIMGAWLLSVLAAIIILTWFPGLILHDAYDPAVVMLAAMLQAGIAVLYVWREPDSTLIQAANRFAPLAMTSVVSSLVAISGVLLLLAFPNPALSLLGILAGQFVMTLLISLLVKQWKNET